MPPAPDPAALPKCKQVGHPVPSSLFHLPLPDNGLPQAELGLRSRVQGGGPSVSRDSNLEPRAGSSWCREQRGEALVGPPLPPLKLEAQQGLTQPSTQHPQRLRAENRRRRNPSGPCWPPPSDGPITGHGTGTLILSILRCRRKTGGGGGSGVRAGKSPSHPAGGVRG